MDIDDARSMEVELEISVAEAQSPSPKLRSSASDADCSSPPTAPRVARVLCPRNLNTLRSVLCRCDSSPSELHELRARALGCRREPCLAYMHMHARGRTNRCDCGRFLCWLGRGRLIRGGAQ